jgi:serine protease Do
MTDEWEDFEEPPPRVWPYWLTAGVLIPAVIGGALLWPLPAEGDVMAGPTVKVIIPGGHGSAVHIGNGYYITAAHVLSHVKEGNAIVRYDDGTEISGVETMWVNTTYDIAMFHVDGADNVESRELQCVDPDVGDIVTTEGNPMALTFVTNYGRVGSLPQTVAPYWASVISIDAGIAPGMSGGPVFNEDGEVTAIIVGAYPGMPIYMAVPGSAICGLLGRV